MLLLVGALLPPAVAQTTGGSITGRVATPDGRPVADAVIEAISPDTGALRTALTDRKGRYALVNLPTGTWKVIARTPGGGSSAPREVRLSLQQAIELDFTVVAEVEETVTVTARPPLVDPQRSWGELRIGKQETEDLPVAGRVVTDLALLDSQVAGVAPAQFFGERSSVFVLNGQSGRGNAFLVDGLDNGDRVSSTTLNSYFSQQVIDEFVVLTQQFAPEFGRAAGGVLNIVTRRGSNNFESDFFVQGTRSNWNSSGPFVAGLPRETSEVLATRRDATGITFGGPIVPDKAFYFFSYERQRSTDPMPYTGVDRNGVAGGVFAADAEDDNFFLRTDFQLSPRHSLMLRLSADDRRTEGLNVGGIYTPEAGFALDEQDVQFAASLQSVWESGLMHELRLLAGRSEFDQQANSSLTAVTRPSGVFGGNPLNMQRRQEERLQLVDNLTLTRGAHTLKLGFDVLRTVTHASVRFNPQGGFLYGTDEPWDPGDCLDLNASQIGQAARDEQEGLGRNPIPCPFGDRDGDGTPNEPGKWWTYPTVYVLVDGHPDVTFRDTQYAFFAQDAWQVTRDLLLHYGLRYDLSTFRLGRDVRVPSDKIPNGGAGRDTDNIAPRLGFTWRPLDGRRIVVRGGAGIFYDKIPLAFPAASAVSSDIAINMIFPQALGFELTEQAVDEFGSDAVRPILQQFPELALRFSTGTELETPYSVQYTLGADIGLGRAGALRIDLNRSLGYHQVLLRDLNPVVEVLTFGGRKRLDEFPNRNLTPFGQPIHRDESLGSIAAIVTEGRSWYTGVTLGWNWRGEQGWASASYTWSRAEDLGFDPLKGGISLPPNSDDLAAERGRSDADRRHRAVFAAGVPLPMGLRGSTVVRYASGAPFNVTLGRDTNLDGQDNDRPEGIGRNTGADTPLEVVNAIRVAEGLSPVTRLEEPDFLQVDFRIEKPFLLRDGRVQGDVYVQVFNAFDRFNPVAVEGRILSDRFGEPYGLGGPPRTIEIGLHLGVGRR